MQIKKIRIAVAIDEKGHWQACGWWNDADGTKAQEICLDAMPEEGIQISLIWVDAEIIVPEVQTVEGEVSNA